MQPDLSPHLHTTECNILVQEEHPVAKLFGKCSDWDEAVWQCTKKERIWRRDNNPRYQKRIVELRRLPVSHWTPMVQKLYEEGHIPPIES